MFDVDLGRAVRSRARFVALWWDARSIPENDKVDFRKLEGVPKASGIYAVTGRHDAGSGPRVLYIGTAKNLFQRMPRSAYTNLSETHAKGQRLLRSDVWDLTIRWARLSPGLLRQVERLLIMSHSPPFNSQSVLLSEPTKKERDLVIMNAGRRGPLFPIVAGAYQATWRDRHGRQLGP